MSRSTLHLIMAYSVFVGMVGGYIWWLSRREKALLAERDRLRQGGPRPSE